MANSVLTPDEQRACNEIAKGIAAKFVAHPELTDAQLELASVTYELVSNAVSQALRLATLTDLSCADAMKAIRVGIAVEIETLAATEVV